MYKVFVNDKPIIFTTSLKNEENFTVYVYKNTTIETLIYKLKQGKLNGVYLYTPTLIKDWELFKTKFTGAVSAGGLVLNEKKEILFIYRAFKWDLPKGRIEIGETTRETAIREVKEECGVKNLTINRKLIRTYHFFIKEGVYKVKETHWYLMNTSYKGKTIPQVEEGITKAVFKKSSQINDVLQNTYANVLLVFNKYQSTK